MPPGFRSAKLVAVIRICSSLRPIGFGILPKVFRMMFCVGRSHCCLLLIVAVLAIDVSLSVAGDASAALHGLFSDEWQRTLKEGPTNASKLGDRRYNRLWPDVSLKATHQSQQRTREALMRLLAIDRSTLSEQDQLNHQLFERQYTVDVAEQQFLLHLLPVNQRGGIQNESSLADLLQFDTVRDYEDWIARLRAFPMYMAQTMALMKQGMREGMLHPAVVMKRVPAQIRKQLVDRPQDSLYYKPFRAFKVELSESERSRLQKAAPTAAGPGPAPRAC